MPQPPPPPTPPHPHPPTASQGRFTVDKNVISYTLTTNEAHPMNTEITSGCMFDPQLTCERHSLDNQMYLSLVKI